MNADKSILDSAIRIPAFILVAMFTEFTVYAADMPNFLDRCNIFGFNLAQKLEVPGQPNTKLESARFRDPTTVSRINDWVSNATEGKIRGFLDNLPSPPMFLANAVYFHAEWNSPFQKQLTQEQPFYPADGSKMTVQMMRQSGSFPYAKGPGFAVVALPYAGNRFAMYCFLPDKGVEALVDQLKKSSWTELARKLRLGPGSVALPKFKLEYSAGLNQALSGLGMGIAFDRDRAQFTRMIEGPQKTLYRWRPAQNISGGGRSRKYSGRSNRRSDARDRQAATKRRIQSGV